MNGASHSPPHDTIAPPIQSAPPPPKKKGLSESLISKIVATIIVIAALGLLGLVEGRILIKKNRNLQARSTMRSLEFSIKGYKTEYLRLPFIDSAAPLSDTSYDFADPKGNALLDILLGTDLKQNPRGIHFWKSSASGGFLMPFMSSSVGGYNGHTPGVGLIDPWRKMGYRIILDYDNDGHITDPEGLRGSIKADVLLYSAGPDGDFATWKDNVCSWRR